MVVNHRINVDQVNIICSVGFHWFSICASTFYTGIFLCSAVLQKWNSSKGLECREKDFKEIKIIDFFFWSGVKTKLLAYKVYLGVICTTVWSKSSLRSWRQAYFPLEHVVIALRLLYAGALLPVRLTPHARIACLFFHQMDSYSFSPFVAWFARAPSTALRS